MTYKKYRKVFFHPLKQVPRSLKCSVREKQQQQQNSWIKRGAPKKIASTICFSWILQNFTYYFLLGAKIISAESLQRITRTGLQGRSLKKRTGARMITLGVVISVLRFDHSLSGALGVPYSRSPVCIIVEPSLHNFGIAPKYVNTLK